MSGVDPWAFMQELSAQMDELVSRTDIEDALDRLEYLMEVLDPELQEPAYELAEQLRRRLQQSDS